MDRIKKDIQEKILKLLRERGKYAKEVEQLNLPSSSGMNKADLREAVDNFVKLVEEGE